MKNILITGGAGFIGSNFVLEILENKLDYKVIVLDSLTYAGNLESLKSVENSPQFVFYKGDIGDKELVLKILKSESIEQIVHFAAESHVDRSIKNPGVFLQTNVMGTFNLLQCAKEFWKAEDYSQKRFLHVSTDEVYGSLGETGLFTEDSSYQPNSPYSASKASSDHIVRSYFHTYQFPVITTNCSNNYGPLQFPEKLIPLMIHNILEKKPLPIYGEGKNIRDWLYVRDHCRGILKVLEKGRLGETYNIGGHNEWKNIDIVNLLCSIMDKKLHRAEGESAKQITYVTDRLGHDMRYAIDASKIEKELGWTPDETFETGIEKTIQWYLDEKDWLKNVTSGDYQNYYQSMYGDKK